MLDGNNKTLVNVSLHHSLFHLFLYQQKKWGKLKKNTIVLTNNVLLNISAVFPLVKLV